MTIDCTWRFGDVKPQAVPVVTGAQLAALIELMDTERQSLIDRFERGLRQLMYWDKP